MVLLLCSCQQRKPQYQAWQPPESPSPADAQEAPEAELLHHVEKVAILPFMDASRGERNNLNFDDLQLVGEQFASHLTGAGTFKGVMYPAEALGVLAGTDLSINRSDDLKEIGNLLDVDAVIFGVIHQYRMYYPPKLSLSMKFYLTRAQRFASSDEISAMAHSGVPINAYNPTFFRQLWDTSAYYDGGSAHVKRTLQHFGKTHTSRPYGFDEQRFLRTKRDFLELISFDLARSLQSSKDEFQQASTVPVKKKTKGRPEVSEGYFDR